MGAGQMRPAAARQSEEHVHPNELPLISIGFFSRAVKDFQDFEILRGRLKFHKKLFIILSNLLQFDGVVYN